MRLVQGLFLTVSLVCRGQSATPDERALWKLWVTCTNNPDAPAAVEGACRDYQAAAAGDPLVTVARGIDAWSLLKLGRTREAASLFTSMLLLPGNATPLQAAGAEMARCWLVRLDREQVREALKMIYRRDVEFPASLEALTTLKIKAVPPLKDRWGAPWVYRRESSIRGMQAQQYSLESSRLGSLSDLAKALDLPYASRITLEPVRPSPIGNDTFEFATPSQKGIFLQAGADKDGIVVAYLGQNVIVMSDGSHWRVMLKPR